MTDFCRRLKEGLDIRGMKPVDLAERLGTSRGAISQYLSGKIAPRQDKLYQISQILNCSPAWLMGADLDMMETHARNLSTTFWTFFSNKNLTSYLR